AAVCVRLMFGTSRGILAVLSFTISLDLHLFCFLARCRNIFFGTLCASIIPAFHFFCVRGHCANLAHPLVEDDYLLSNPLINVNIILHYFACFCNPLISLLSANPPPIARYSSAHDIHRGSRVPLQPVQRDRAFCSP